MLSALAKPSNREWMVDRIRPGGCLYCDSYNRRRCESSSGKCNSKKWPARSWKRYRKAQYRPREVA
jgi:hypothetical protein